MFTSANERKMLYIANDRRLLEQDQINILFKNIFQSPNSENSDIPLPQEQIRKCCFLSNDGISFGEQCEGKGYLTYPSWLTNLRALRASALFQMNSAL